MPTPVAICLEDLGAAGEASRYTQCVAISGREPGLGVSARGALVWQSAEPLACELWVSADERLILYRPEGAGPVEVRRDGRGLEVPFAKPVVLLHEDELAVAGRHLRVHVHGVAATVHPPMPLAARPSAPTPSAPLAPPEPIAVRPVPPYVAPPSPPVIPVAPPPSIGTRPELPSPPRPPKK